MSWIWNFTIPIRMIFLSNQSLTIWVFFSACILFDVSNYNPKSLHLQIEHDDVFKAISSSMASMVHVQFGNLHKTYKKKTRHTHTHTYPHKLPRFLLLLAEILHHLGCMKPYKWWGYFTIINWLAGNHRLSLQPNERPIHGEYRRSPPRECWFEWSLSASECGATFIWLGQVIGDVTRQRSG